MKILPKTIEKNALICGLQFTGHVFLGFIVLLTIAFKLAYPVFAEDFTSLDVASSYIVADKNAVDGDVLSTDKNGLVRSKVSYDTKIFGVLTIKPLVAFRVPGSSEIPVSRNGTVRMNVSTYNGTIEKGDLITSSEVVGKGMKASTSGYVFGTALEKFDGSTATEEVVYGGQKYKLGKILVALRVEYADINSPQSFKRLFDYVGVAFFSNVKDPNRFGQVVRYISAGLIVLASIVFAFVTFSKAIPKGIEAIGRNPLAKIPILFSIVLSIVFMVVTIGLGVVAAVVVLRI